MLANRSILVKGFSTNLSFIIGIVETSSYLSVNSVFLFLSLVTIDRQTSYDSGILRIDYGIIYEVSLFTI